MKTKRPRRPAPRRRLEEMDSLEHSTGEESSSETDDVTTETDSEEERFVTDSFTSAGETSASDAEHLARRAGRKRTILSTARSNSGDVYKKLTDMLADMTVDEIRAAVKVTDRRGNNALHYAAMNKSASCVGLLLENYADPNTIGRGGMTALHFALSDKKMPRKGDGESSVQKVVEKLVENDAELNIEDSNGVTPLLMAVNLRGHKNPLKVLLENAPSKVDVEQPAMYRGSKVTVLIAALQQSKFSRAIMLVEAGADPLCRGPWGNTPLYLILKRRQPCYADQFLKACKRKGHNVRKILEAKNHKNHSTLHEVIETKDVKLLNDCLQIVFPEEDQIPQSLRMDSDDFPDIDLAVGLELLSARSKRNATLMHTACKVGQLEIMEVLQDRCPALLYEKNEDGQLPLHYACKYDQAEAVKKLCEWMT